MKETLAEYLERVMTERRMKVADLVAASGLSQPYLNRLLKGTSTNLTIETITSLAKALGVDEFEIFAAACGKAPENKSVDLLVLAAAINKIILNPMLVELVENMARLKAKHQQAIFATARSLAAKAKAGKKNNK